VSINEVINEYIVSSEEFDGLLHAFLNGDLNHDQFSYAMCFLFIEAAFFLSVPLSFSRTFYIYQNTQFYWKEKI
jgi:hypothetical protein